MAPGYLSPFTAFISVYKTKNHTKHKLIKHEEKSEFKVKKKTGSSFVLVIKLPKVLIGMYNSST